MATMLSPGIGLPKSVTTSGLPISIGLLCSSCGLYSELTAHYGQLTATVRATLTHWKIHDQAATDEIETKRKALEAQGIRLEMGFIQKLTNDATAANQNLGTLATWTTELQRLQKYRAALSPTPLGSPRQN